MAEGMTDVFDPAGAGAFIERIRSLSPQARPLWGSMDVATMLAHCSVPYELAFQEGGHSRPGAVKRLLFRLVVKPGVVNEKAYRKGLPTAPEFRITGTRDFGVEQERLVAYVKRTARLGRGHFEGGDYPNFGPLSAREWNNLFAKHLDHHLRQFGV